MARTTAIRKSVVSHHGIWITSILLSRCRATRCLWDGGVRLGYDSVNRWFLLVSCQTGLRKPGDQCGPRVHDLRHHFAIQTMLQWYRTDTDVEARLPELSTYLGHAHVSDTYWYLQATPKLLGEVAIAAETLHQRGVR